MFKMGSNSNLILLFHGIFYISSLLAAPTIDLELPNLQSKAHTNIEEAVGDWAKNTMNAVRSKIGVVEFLAQTSANAAAEGFRSGAKFANGLEIEAAVNRTEEAVKANKIAMIESVFAVKRQALRAVSSIKQEFTAVMSSFLNASIDNLNTALTAAQNGMIASKTFVADIAGAITINNTVSVATDVEDAVTGSIETTLDNLNSTGYAILTSLVNAKQKLADAAENFSSQEILHSGTGNLADAVSTTFNKVEAAVDEIGVFESLDNIVHSFGQMPNKLNSLVKTSFLTESEEEPEVKTDTDESEPEMKETSVFTEFEDELEVKTDTEEPKLEIKQEEVPRRFSYTDMPVQ